MAVIFNKCDLPTHLFNIPELDFSEDLFADPQGGLWFRLGAWTNTPQRDDQGIEDVVSRQTIMLSPAGFADIYDNLESIGNVLHDLGEPRELAGDEYGYAPFHQFELMRASLVGEPLVFVRDLQSGVELFVNPDLVLYFGLEERADESGIWWHPERGVEALRRQIIENGNLQIIEIRIAYLLKYLRVRQMSLLVGHYRHLHLYNPSRSSCEAFVEGDIVLGAPDQGAKAIFQNWGLRQDIPSEPFLQRRLHLWFEIKPPEIDTDSPWADEPPFDPYAFTLLTRYGPVAPARWKLLQQTEGREFVGQTCDFVERTFFRQEVLSKYEGMSGFKVLDDGSVLCGHYWALSRSTSRIGNELLSTAIGDFAEGVPFEEWPHWKQYSVEPPSSETIRVFGEEQTVPDAINALVSELNELNMAFENFVHVMNVEAPNPLWTGDLTSLAVRQLKQVYPPAADDDELLTRATLLSTLVIDGLDSRSLRVLLRAIGEGLYLRYDGQGQSLGSRNLLQRVALIAALIENIQSAIAEIPMLVMQAEGQATSESGSDLQMELEELWRKTRKDLAPLAFLYDLRLHGGIAHAPNKEKVATAAAGLELPRGNWHRIHYLYLLDLVTKSVTQVGRHLGSTATKLRRDGFPIPG